MDARDALSTLRPGDLLLVRRIPSVWQWVRHPIKSYICHRIRVLSRSRWNHVACAIGDGELVEADWAGVLRRPVGVYDRPGKYEVKVIRHPLTLNAEAATRRWKNEAGKEYDRALIGRLWWAAMRGGIDAMRRVIHDARDGRWICSELAAAGWTDGGVTAQGWSPGAFDAA